MCRKVWGNKKGASEIHFRSRKVVSSPYSSLLFSFPFLKDQKKQTNKQTKKP